MLAPIRKKSHILKVDHAVGDIAAGVKNCLGDNVFGRGQVVTNDS